MANMMRRFFIGGTATASNNNNGSNKSSSTSSSASSGSEVDLDIDEYRAEHLPETCKILSDKQQVKLLHTAIRDKMTDYESFAIAADRLVAVSMMSIQFVPQSLSLLSSSL
jgi:hypothetical protein